MGAFVDEFTPRYDQLIFDPLMRRYYGLKGYYNVGYWGAGICTQEQACDNLVERLVNGVPEQAGSILDAACGLGATTCLISSLRPASRIVGINISARQLERCRQVAPDCHFLQMDASHTGLRDLLFDAVVCVEAAFHFHTRKDFLREAWRMLKPGGHLLLSDILFRSEQWAGAWTVPHENSLPDVAAYRHSLDEAGFDHINIEDATDACWNGFCRNLGAWIDGQHGAAKIREDEWQMWTRIINGLANEAVAHYLLVAARKPLG
jgi:MPBQ/MSBQ methyltransferase